MLKLCLPIFYLLGALLGFEHYQTSITIDAVVSCLYLYVVGFLEF